MASSRGIGVSFKLKEILHDIVGVTAVEYELIAAMCVLGTIAGLNSLGSSLQNLLSTVMAAVIGVTN